MGASLYEGVTSITLDAISAAINPRANARSSSGANWLNGSDGDDYLFGGGGNDILVGGIEMDTFVWRAGDQGTESAPAVDTITDFDMSASGDKLDLRDILVGEHSDAAILGNFLDIGSSGGDTTISVRTQGLLGGVDQQIVLQGVDLTSGGNLSESQILTNLLSANKIVVDL